MRSGLIVLVLVVGAGAPAMAQSALDGPLAAPGASPAASARQIGKARAKPKRAHHAAARTGPPAADTPAPPAASAADGHPPAPDDRVNLGMKWNGNNDTAAQTRYQNLNGNAAGTGAEVGLKLHF